jgi:SAM-dependent methyltransferase
MGTIVWGPEIAERYDEGVAAQFDPAVLDPMVDLLAELAAEGRALELAIGTGRVALPLSERGVEVAGIELSPHMAERLRAKPGAEGIAVAIGDMATTEVEERFSLVYLVFNTIMNVTTQAEQVAVFRNAARHLEPGGRFVVEVIVPPVRRLPAGETSRVFHHDEHHVGVDTFDDQVGQISWSHHWTNVDGRWRYQSAPYRYVWPSELDLMGELAGLHLDHRWADWHRAPFTSDSDHQVAVYQLPG